LRHLTLQETIRVVPEPQKGSIMAVAELKKYPKDENRLERLAERVANEINERAANMTTEERAKADSETAKIATQVRRRTP
jgi:hypothetical protein